MSDIIIELDGEKLQLPETVEVSVTQQIESEDDFTQKMSSISLNISVPATANNSRLLNTFFDPAAEDLSGAKRGILPAAIIASGDDILIGKAILQSATHNERPLTFDISIYGDNADWAIENQELNLYDCLSTATHPLTHGVIDDSWDYDGTDPDADYVYAPVRYATPFSDSDTNVEIIDMKPSLSIYWLLRRGFEKAGYSLKSEFMDSDFFRRLVMPWTWGGFLTLEGAATAILMSKAIGTSNGSWQSGAPGGYDFIIGNTEGFVIDNETTNGGFDNGNTYTWGSNVMQWTYPGSVNFGSIKGVFKFYSDFSYIIGYSCSVNVELRWSINGILEHTEVVLSDTLGSGFGTISKFATISSEWTSPALNPGDLVSLQVRVYGSEGGGNYVQYFFPGYLFVPAENRYRVTSFEVIGFLMTNGSIVNFKNYGAFKGYKWLDMLRGLIDDFDLQLGTNPRTKEVFIELAFSEDSPYYKNEIDFTRKQDLSKISKIENFSSYQQSLVMDFKVDSSDGLTALVKSRTESSPFMAKYKFPDRFQKGENRKENRFFSGIIHYDASQFKYITGTSPQLISLIPEGVADTSAPEAKFQFAPKMAYYKGKVTGYGGITLMGGDQDYLPMMFAVNYKSGGENDPVLTYCDQNINGVVAPGLMRKYFAARLAILTHGKRYTTWLRLFNSDLMNTAHREYITINGVKYILIKINNYKYGSGETTEVSLWQVRAITQEILDAIYPTQLSVSTGILTNDENDIKYGKSLALPGDIPL